MPRLRNTAGGDDGNDDPRWVRRIVNREQFRVGYGKRVPLPRIYPYQQPQPQQHRPSRSPSFAPPIDGDNDTVMSETGMAYDNNDNDNDNNNNDDWEDIEEGGEEGVDDSEKNLISI